MHGFGCPLLARVVQPNPDVLALGARYVALDDLPARADVMSLLVPLRPTTHRLLDAAALARCKRAVTIPNTHRGKLIDTEALIEA
jgi:D-lactate dehydrogenase